MVVPSSMINKKTATKALKYQWFRPWLSGSAIFSICFTVGRKLSGCFTMGMFRSGDSSSDDRSGKSRPETDRQSMIRTFTIFGDEWQKHACLGWAADPRGCKHGHHTDWTIENHKFNWVALHRTCTALGKNRKESFCQLQVWPDKIISSLIIQMYSGNVSLQKPVCTHRRCRNTNLQNLTCKSSSILFFRGWNTGQFEASGAWHSWTSYVQRCLAKCHRELPLSPRLEKSKIDGNWRQLDDSAKSRPPISQYFSDPTGNHGSHTNLVLAMPSPMEHCRPSWTLHGLNTDFKGMLSIYHARMCGVTFLLPQ